MPAALAVAHVNGLCMRDVSVAWEDTPPQRMHALHAVEARNLSIDGFRAGRAPTDTPTAAVRNIRAEPIMGGQA